MSLRELLGVDFPLVAFSHCRDVVAAVTNAGGFGVLGAQTFTPEQLDQELTWIDEHVGGRPYGADVIIPTSYASGPELVVPAGHRAFVADLLAAHGIDLTVDDALLAGRPTVREGLGEELLDVVFDHPVRLVANALGVPPPSMIRRAKATGVPVAALVGSREHALAQVRAGVDVVVAQGTEAGGHTGEVSTMVLVPEVVEAVAPVPVLAAGGIVTGRQVAAAVALGAAGAWTGSVWLTTREAGLPASTVRKLLAASSRDTVRSTARTGKPARQLASAWTSAWSTGPAALPMPVQGLLAEPVLRRLDTLADKGNEEAMALVTYFVGQGVGLMNAVAPAAEVVRAMAEDYLAATERLAGAS
ncbi:monooxygenase [Actinophytocola xinjiangensis]|uniref:Monooxygenase n=1 Tax=Actinophytocola xinjiangensis TaxID=485602 RepID=A0A7Z1AVP2_9PSEU|nr:nitronate monooxygenase [Actinophytocola xinjiangensis]OLF06666.1 monooxygenase [Actinophytocola xinjiangensis]